MKNFLILLMVFASCFCARSVSVTFESPPFDKNMFIVDQPHNYIGIRSAVTNDPFGSIQNIQYYFLSGTNYFILVGTITNNTTGASSVATNSPDGLFLDTALTNTIYTNAGPAVVVFNHTAFLNTNSFGGGSGTLTNGVYTNAGPATMVGGAAHNILFLNTNGFGGGGSFPSYGLTNFDTRNWTNLSIGFNSFAGEVVANTISVTAGANIGTDLTWGGTGSGNGSSITALNASQLTSGTVPVPRLPVATTSALGVIKPDGTSILISGGVISAPGAGGGTITALTGDVSASGSGSVVATVLGAHGTLYASLATGILKNTTGTGVPSIAVAGTDYLTPTGNGSGLTALNGTQITSGTVPTPRLPVGTSAALGVLQVDGTSITVSGGVISAPGAGGGTITALTGDVSASGSGSVAATLATVLSSPGTYRSVTANGKGLVTAGSNPTTFGGYAISDTWVDFVAAVTGIPSFLTANQTITLSGDTTGSGTTAITTTLKNTGTAGTYRSTTFDPQGRETSGSNPTTFAGYGISDTWPNLASDLTLLIPQSALGTGSGGAGTKFLADDQTYKVASAGGITALTGDVSASGSGSVVATLNNIPTGTTMAGSLLDTAIVAPATPASGKGQIYEDSTSKNLALKNDAGAINHGVQTKTVTTHQWISAIADDGSSTASQPAFTDISGTATPGQLPIATTSALGVVQVGTGLAITVGGLLTTSGGSGISSLSPTNSTVPSVVGSVGYVPTGFISNSTFNVSAVQHSMVFGGFATTNWVLTQGFGSGNASGVAADFDTNGVQDFVLPRAASSLVVFTNGGFQNNFNLSVTAGGAFTLNAAAQPTCVCVGDFNGDGRPDILVQSASAVQLFTNSGPSASGQISFVQLGSNYAITSGTGLYAADFNNDGSIDFIESGSAGSATEWTNNGIGVFVQNTAFTFPTYAKSALVGNIGHFMGTTNWDLVLDISGSPIGVLLLTNDSKGTFVISSTQLDLTANGSIGTNDFNNDGKLDIVVNESANSKVQVFTNNGSGAFGDYSTNGVSGGGGSDYQIFTADFNVDGSGDILVPNSTAGYTILTNDYPRIGFNGMQTNLIWASTLVPFIGDFNADGRPDIAEFGTTAGNFVVWDQLNLPIIQGILIGDGTNIYNGSVAVAYSSSVVTPANAWTPGVAPSAGQTSVFGTFNANTNYLKRTAIADSFIQGTVMTANSTATATFNSVGNSETIYNTSASTIASLAITLSSSANPGMINRYATHGICTSVTVTGTVSVGAAVTALTADSTVAWQAINSSTWVRIQ
jgi:FG-GAP-like repeat